MQIEIKTPMLPESVTEATMLTWHKAVGDQVRRDEILVDVETEKIVLEVPAPQDGVLHEIMKPEGEIIVAEEVLCVIDTDGAAVPEAKATPAPPATAETTESAVTPAHAAVSPAVRRFAHEHNVDLKNVSGTGKDGRVTKADLVDFVESKPSEQVAKVAPPPAPKLPVAEPPKAAATGEREQRRVPMSRIRRTIATRLVESQQNAALLTTFNEVDLSEVMALRAKYRDSFEKKHGVRLGFMSFFVKAAVESLKNIPAVNAYIDGDDIVYNEHYDIGIAVSSPRGLVVPIVRDAQTKGFAQIEAEIRAYGQKAKSGQLAMADLVGGTFTITNGGVFGSLVSTPIVNPPQSAILGMHKIQERPVAENGAVVVRPMMYLALTYDHRIIDGREAVTFLVGIKNALEDPARLLLEL